MSADIAAGAPCRMLRIKNASLVLDIPPSTLRRLCALGLVPAEKIGRSWRVKVAYVDKVTALADETTSASEAVA